MIERQEPYRPRSIRFLELWQEAGWRIKLYGIAYRGGRPSAGLIDAAKRVARARLPRPATGGGRYGVGFLGVHQGRGANLVFLDWWADENELHHHVYLSGPEDPERLEYRTPGGLAACVWDLHLIAFERDAWVEAVLKGADEDSLEAYLERRLSGEV